ncbi:MAG: thiopeptide-type bacteriocin biosynthesis protein, partial [Stackebrandtia sp.]
SAVARLIDEISASGRGLWQRWNWGQTGMVLPYTPRLRTGRTVLAPESWIPDARLVDKRLSWREWRERFSAWRDRWRVPDKASVVFADHQLPLDLTDALHLRILRDELQSSSHVRLHEQLEGGHGWLEGYANEIVVPLAASGSPTQLSPPVAPARSIDVSHRPGGEWLSLNLYADSERHDEILAGNVAAVVRRLSDAADRWFFVRYFDAGSHLRLRFRRKRAKDLADMLSIVNDWGTRLCDDGLAKDFSIVTYRPEIHRYGGPEAIAKAEKLFHADSVAVLEQLALRRQGLDVEAEILCAAELVDMARLFDPVGWEGRVLQIYRERTRYREYRARQRELLDLIDPEGDWPALRISPARLSVLAAWAARARAVADYGVHIRRLEKTGALWTSANGVLASTFHMHVNRSLGIDPEREQKVYAVVSAVTRARQTRRKHLQNE